MPYDIEEVYSFYCARYINIKFSDFLKIGYDEFKMKINSIPENEPLFKKLKSRAIELSKIKDKEERKYWRELKEINKIPDIYLPNDEIERDIKEKLKKEGIKNVR